MYIEYTLKYCKTWCNNRNIRLSNIRLSYIRLSQSDSLCNTKMKRF